MFIAAEKGDYSLLWSSIQYHDYLCRWGFVDFIYFFIYLFVYFIAEYSVRLRGGTTPFEGHVEVLVEDEWGAILDTQWDLNDATVICRQLGFSAAKVNLSAGFELKCTNDLYNG